jgi:hypothetical protein
MKLVQSLAGVVDSAMSLRVSDLAGIQEAHAAERRAWEEEREALMSGTAGAEFRRVTEERDALRAELEALKRSRAVAKPAEDAAAQAKMLEMIRLAVADSIKAANLGSLEVPQMPGLQSSSSSPGSLEFALAADGPRKRQRTAVAALAATLSQIPVSQPPAAKKKPGRQPQNQPGPPVPLQVEDSESAVGIPEVLAGAASTPQPHHALAAPPKKTPAKPTPAKPRKPTNAQLQQQQQAAQVAPAPVSNGLLPLSEAVGAFLDADSMTRLRQAQGTQAYSISQHTNDAARQNTTFPAQGGRNVARQVSNEILAAISEDGTNPSLPAAQKRILEDRDKLLKMRAAAGNGAYPLQTTTFAQTQNLATLQQAIAERTKPLGYQQPHGHPYAEHASQQLNYLANVGPPILVQRSQSGRTQYAHPGNSGGMVGHAAGQVAWNPYGSPQDTMMSPGMPATPTSVQVADKAGLHDYFGTAQLGTQLASSRGSFQLVESDAAFQGKRRQQVLAVRMVTNAEPPAQYPMSRPGLNHLDLSAVYHTLDSKSQHEASLHNGMNGHDEYWGMRTDQAGDLKRTGTDETAVQPQSSSDFQFR